MNDRLLVLVVDDEDKIREGCRRVLTGNDFDVVTAENGVKAMEVMAADGVDLMLLDLKMPVMDGEKVLERMQVEHPNIPIIIITGHGTLDTAVQCMRKGAYDFVTKPFQIQQFLATINRAAEKRRLEKTARLAQEEQARNLYDLDLEKGRLKTIINCLGNGVMVTNRGLEVVLYNPSLMELAGINEALTPPVPLNRIIEDQAILDTLQGILSGDQRPALVSQEIEYNKKFLRAISAPARGPDGRVVGTVTVLEDISTFKQLDRMKSDFIAMVAHELRSPLFSVSQMLHVMQKGLCGPLEEKQEDFLGRSMKQLNNLVDLIRDLLEISKADAGMLVQQQVPVDLEEAARKVIEVMEVRAEAQNIELCLSCEGLPPVTADPRSINEIFNNLITNAINYSPGGGRVTVELKGLGDLVEIKVSDTGVGISPDQLPKIFDKFYRAKNPKTRQVVGTGLGLSLVKGIVEAHHGSIEAESQPDRGTTFRIVLPVFKNA